MLDYGNAQSPTDRIIAHNLTWIRERIASACALSGREDGAVRIVAVTKSVDIAEIGVLHRLGVCDFGENRVPIARQKIEASPPELTWHMIGNIQRRKAADVVEMFSHVDAIDRIELAEALQRECDRQDKRLHVLLEVNVSGETSKHGFAPEALAKALNAIRQCERLTVDGLMTMAPLVDNPEDVRPYFRALRRLTDDAGLPEVSMGMSNDFVVAVEEGATQVRIGTALFEETKESA